MLAEATATAASAAPHKVLKVGGYTPFTATDYPGKLAAVVFVQGCPWRCGYCHNPHLQSRTTDSPVPWAAVLARLRRRVGLIDAVVFSGGEPTMDPGLEEAICAVRAMGFSVGLHTAGMYPQRLAAVLPLVDWVGMDIKASAHGYDAITGVAHSDAPAFASAAQVLASGVAYEFRTTLHPTLQGPAQVRALAQQLHAMGVRHYALQQFRSTGCNDGALRSAASAARLDAPLLAEMDALFDTFSYRHD